MKFTVRLFTILRIALVALSSCEEGERIRPSTTENVNRILLTSPVETMSFDEFIRVDERIKTLGFTVADNCVELGNQTTQNWEDAVTDSYNIISIDDDNEEITFQVLDLPFTIYDCAPFGGAVYCGYFGETLRVFSTQGTSGCLLGEFVLTTPIATADINIRPLALPEDQACAPVCFGN